MEKTTVGVKLEPAIRKRLRALGKSKQRSTHWLMKEAIQRYLDEEEEQERAKQETLERWERYEATGKAVSNADVTGWLKSWGTEKEKPWPKRGG